ncbi:MAG: hypothetical protein MUF40_08040, partial [Gemmatimonadaceae bacterium]|nr:hypothetical protein [Gemmatimonadaceae bacterium]
MDAGGVLHPAEADAGLVALRDEEVAHAARLALARADVEVEPRVAPRLMPDVVEDRGVREPEARAHHAREAEGIVPFEEAVERDEPAHAAAGEAGVRAVADRAEALIDDRAEDVGDPVDVGARPATADLRVLEGAVLEEAPLGAVPDADDDRVGAEAGGRGERVDEAPGAGERGRVVEEVLPVVHVHDRPARRRLAVARGDRDDDAA